MLIVAKQQGFSSFIPQLPGTYDFQVFYRIAEQWHWFLPTDNDQVVNQVFVGMGAAPFDASSCTPYNWTTITPVRGLFIVSRGFLGHDDTEYKGIDIVPLDANSWNVYAVADGVVKAVRSDSPGQGDKDPDPAGNYVVISHEAEARNGRYGYTPAVLYTQYMHLSEVYVQEGSITAGQLIGKIGNTGNTRSESGGDGSHLHLQIHEEDRYGPIKDPREYVYLGNGNDCNWGN